LIGERGEDGLPHQRLGLVWISFPGAGSLYGQRQGGHRNSQHRHAGKLHFHEHRPSGPDPFGSRLLLDPEKGFNEDSREIAATFPKVTLNLSFVQ
jgi:hypothetical protein